MGQRRQGVQHRHKQRKCPVELAGGGACVAGDAAVFLCDRDCGSGVHRRKLFARKAYRQETVRTLRVGQVLVEIVFLQQEDCIEIGVGGAAEPHARGST
jgi:hypothetical protein